MIKELTVRRHELDQKIQETKDEQIRLNATEHERFRKRIEQMEARMAAQDQAKREKWRPNNQRLWSGNWKCQVCGTKTKTMGRWICPICGFRHRNYW
jgi:rubrerythrin